MDGKTTLEGLAVAITAEAAKKNTDEAFKAYEAAIRADEREKFIQMLEARRKKVLAAPHDPSWTEHFAELQNEVRAMK